MGLRDELQADIAEAFNEDLADAVHTFTCERISKTNWDPKTETHVEVKENSEAALLLALLSPVA